ncbi:hypothetical protein NL676_038679 [Syzygium grande]|nr:hypothetical protein NL676_038679 [Syzygium grande]
MAMKFGGAMMLVAIASVMMGALVAYPRWNNNNGYAWPPKQYDVFKFDPPSDNNTHPHSVYVFQNFWTYMRCDLKRATKVANVSDGAGDGFERVHLEPEVEVLLLRMRRERQPPLPHREDAVLHCVASSPLEVARLIGPNRLRKRQCQCLFFFFILLFN